MAKPTGKNLDHDNCTDGREHVEALPSSSGAVVAPRARESQTADIEVDVRDITLISGIGKRLAHKLRGMGVATLRDISELDDPRIEQIDRELDFKGRILREDWIGQAKALLGRPAKKVHDREGEQLEPDSATTGAGQDQTPQADDAPQSKEDKLLAAGPPEFCPDFEPRPSRRSTHALDRAFRAQLARMTLAITPAGLAANVFDWLAHLAISPGKQVELMENATNRYIRFLNYIGQILQPANGELCEPCIKPLSGDNRFEGEDWQKWPFNFMHQWFLLHQEFWQNATNDVEGLSRHEEHALSFTTRQMLDHLSPSNFVLTNPEVLQATIEQGGQNLVRGACNSFEDSQRFIRGRLPVGAEDFVIGKDLAATEGKVVFRNHLIELIQYAPKSETVHPEPILITPAWIMKYYILDLSPHNSLVKYLVEQGFTVFMISWRNPTAADRDLSMNDYIRMGVFDALRVMNAIVPEKKVHAVGYCIGGTLLMMAAAAMARDDGDRLKSITLFAAQTDFTEAGEIMLFTGESQVSYIEGLMWDQGYLDNQQMAGAFQLLQSNDLIWSRYVNEYLLGRRQEMFDLLAWNADATRMPYKMHSEYLRKLFLHNELAQSRFVVGDEPVSLTDIRARIFCVSTTADHVAPWRSVYKLHLLADTDITFVLANRGHNAGIVSEPGHKGRKYQIRTTREGSKYVPPDEWRENTPVVEGSWWPALVEWLLQDSEQRVAPPGMGSPEHGYAPIENAPGSYVHQR